MRLAQNSLFQWPSLWHIWHTFRKLLQQHTFGPTKLTCPTIYHLGIRSVQIFQIHTHMCFSCAGIPNMHWNKLTHTQLGKWLAQHTCTHMVDIKCMLADDVACCTKLPNMTCNVFSFLWHGYPHGPCFHGKFFAQGNFFLVIFHLFFPCCWSIFLLLLSFHSN